MFTFFSLFSLCAEHKIIYLIAPPRTLSTAFLRSVYARGDFTVYSEPCESIFHLKYDPENSWVTINDLLFKNYEEVKQELLRASKVGNVFVKDITYSAHECFYNDEEFLSNPNVEFCFLMRSPHDALISLYNALGYYDYAYFDWVNARSMYKLHYELFKKIERIKGKVPLVITSEDLSCHSYEVMNQFCDDMGIDFQDSMISWSPLGKSFDLREWNMYFPLEPYLPWYKGALGSTHFVSCMKKYDVDEQREPTFIELPESDRFEVKKVYDLQMKYYTRMKELV